MSASISRVGSYFFLIVGLLALGYAAYVVVDAHAYQAYEQSKFEDVGIKEPPALLVEGGVIGEIQVPRLQLKAIVVQGDTHTILRRAVGHVPETALPGSLGNVVLAGHRDTFFRPLRNIRLGDAITLKTTDGAFQYLVESTEVVPATDVEVLNATAGRTLTLITCFPFDYIGPAPNRYVVRARELVPPSPDQPLAP
ncbi:MAG TPA: class D sortase [Candidatus Acidoferrum sp.]|nr:class D sortase [Candidatus Acidoferrum sp.]